MKFNYAILFVLLVAIIFVSGCAKQEEKTTPTIAPPDVICINACNEALNASINLESGPCLLESVPYHIDYVCDVAHSPRQSVDNLPENQCLAYRNGTAKHFIEVAPDCTLIRTV